MIIKIIKSHAEFPGKITIFWHSAWLIRFGHTAHV